MEASLSDLYSNVTYHHLEERDISSDNSGDNSPPSTTFTTASISSPKRSRRAIQKKVVTFPLKEVEGSRFKGDCTPPSDSWAWRKYGQKPIKGSPYPRGYYRCSSSKGCPARKQVERSRSDPNTLVVTYSYEHNHPWPISRNHHQNRHHNNNAATSTTAATASTQAPEHAAVAPAVGPNISSLSHLPSSTATTHNFTADNNNVTNTTSVVQPRLLGNDNNLADHHHHQQQQQQQQHHHQTILFQQNMDHQEPLIPPTDELTWLASDHQLFENNSFFSNFNDVDMAKIFPMREEDESLFADLGELPECSVVFRKAVGAAAGGEESNLAPTATWCGTTG